MNNTGFECQGNEILDSPIQNSVFTSFPEPLCIQDRIPVPQVNKTQTTKSEFQEKYIKDTLNPCPVPCEAPESLNPVSQTSESCFSEQDEENPKIMTHRAPTQWNELAQPACTPVYTSSDHSFGTLYPSYAWYVYHHSSSNGSAITHTCQEIASYAVQPPPSGMLTTFAASVHNAHSNLLYSQYFSCFAEQPRANTFVPANGYFQSQMPIYYHFQPLNVSHCASQQLLPQAAYPFPSNPHVRPEVPWAYGKDKRKPGGEERARRGRGGRKEARAQAQGAASAVSPPRRGRAPPCPARAEPGGPACRPFPAEMPAR
ncbi:testis-expressed protein 15-like [Ctenodactylus gundi]